MRLRKRAMGLMIGAGVLFFLGTNVQAGWLFVLAAMLLGVVVAGVVLPVRATRGVQAQRRAPLRLHQGEETLVDVIVQGGRRTRRGLVVRDRLLEPVDLWVGSVRPGERVEITTLRVARRRGEVFEPTISVRSSAPFGVAERRRTTTVEGGRTLVLPVVETLGPLPFVRPAPTTEVAMHTAPRRGSGPEYLGIREYRPGDSMRHVHWASTARTGAMMVREFEQEQTRRLAIVVDASRDAIASSGQLTPLDRVCSAAASIALAASAAGHGARLLSGDAERGSVDVLGGVGGDELMERLSLLTPMSTPFPVVLEGSQGSLRGVETAVLVFPTWATNDAERLVPAIGRLVEEIPVVVAVPVVLDPRVAGDVLAQEALDGLLQRLRAAGATVRPWRAGQALDVALGAEPAEVGLR